MDKLLKSSIRTLNKIYQENAVTPVEVTKACMEQVCKIKPLNAFITLTSSEATAQAEECTKRMKSCKHIGPLDGVPLSIKDIFCTKNIPTTCASKMLQNFISPFNSTVYQKLLDAGAIIIGKTNLDQFAMGSGCVDSLYGPTKNPWNFSKNADDFHISGGSSGGSAVSVATKCCFGSLGSDTGGSIRMPASYCGIVGLKPSYGLISRYGLIPLVNSMDCPGILARSIDDCVVILNTIAGPDPKDSTTIKCSFSRVWLQNNVCLKGLKVGIPKEYFCDNLTQEVYETWQCVADILEGAGACVKQISMPHTKYSIVCYSILNQCDISSNMARYDGIHFGFTPEYDKCSEKIYTLSRTLGFNDVVRSRILTGNYFLIKSNYEKYFLKALKIRRLIQMDFDEAFSKVNVLLIPTTLSTAPLYKDFISKNNRDQCAVQDYCTQPINMAGVPALSIPIRLSPCSNLPISLQLVSRHMSECVLLTVGKFIESVVQFPELQCDL